MTFLFVRYDRCHPLVAYCCSVVACHSHTFLWILFSFFSSFFLSWHWACRVIYVWQYDTDSVIMSKRNWIWGFRAASGRNLQMNLECRKTLCSIHSLVTLLARLSHYEGQRGRNEGKKPQELDWEIKGKGGEDRRMKTKNKRTNWDGKPFS